MIDLTGKVALVTGASRGIGRACAERLAECGAAVVVNFLSSRDAACETVQEITRRGGNAIAVRADVSDRDDVMAMIDAVKEHFGRLNIIVSNAAAGGFRPLMNATPTSFEGVLRVNASPLIWLTQAAASMLQAGPEVSKVIAISSHGASRGILNYGAIGASKAALESLVRHFAMELGRSGINFNTVLSGILATEAVRTMPGVESILQAVKDSLLVPPRDLQTSDIAAAVAFLASPLSDMIQGQTIVVDGGVSIRA